MVEETQSGHIVRFGVYELDLRAGELRKNGSRIKLQEKPFQVLALLLERSGEVVTREEFQQRIWPDTFVDIEHSLSTAVKKLRDALDDQTDNPRFIETRPGRGYRFIYPVEGAAAKGSGLFLPWWAWVTGGLAALLLLAVGLNVGGLRYRLFGGVAPGDITSIAVLPFENVGGDPDAEYLSDGMAESLIEKLSRLPNLKVMARSTVFRYKGPDVDPLKAGQDLEVGAVLTGRIHQRGETLIISAELVNVADGTQLWGEQYNRPMADIFAIQESIARQISDNLRLRLTAEGKTKLAKRHTENAEAYQLYLRGRFFWNQRTADAMKKGLGYFQQALAEDPAYALAYSGVADSYNMLASYEVLPPGEAYPKAKAAARKGLALDETLAEAHTSLARALYMYDWDWAGAEKEFQRALELNSNYAIGHLWYGVLLSYIGRGEDSIRESRIARDLEPLSRVTNTAVAYSLYENRNYEEAFKEIRGALEIAPDYTGMRDVVAKIYLALGKKEDSIKEFQQAVTLSKRNPQYLAGLGNAYSVAGKRTEALAILNELIARSEQEHIPSDAIALVYIGLDQKDAAFEWLEKAYNERSTWIMLLKVDPIYDPLRDDPRFQDLLRRMNFPSREDAGQADN